jgi:hypothetical protein
MKKKIGIVGFGEMGKRHGREFQEATFGQIEIAGVVESNDDMERCRSMNTTITGRSTIAGVDTYYDSTLEGNAYLNGANYDLWGGNGMLVAAVPEGASLYMVLTGAAIFGLLQRKGRLV